MSDTTPTANTPADNDQYGNSSDGCVIMNGPFTIENLHIHCNSCCDGTGKDTTGTDDNSDTENPGGDTDNPGEDAENPGDDTENPGEDTENPGEDTENPGGSTQLDHTISTVSTNSIYSSIEVDSQNRVYAVGYHISNHSMVIIDRITHSPYQVENFNLLFKEEGQYIYRTAIDNNDNIYITTYGGSKGRPYIVKISKDMNIKSQIMVDKRPDSDYTNILNIFSQDNYIYTLNITKNYAYIARYNSNLILDKAIRLHTSMIYRMHTLKDGSFFVFGRGYIGHFDSDIKEINSYQISNDIALKHFTETDQYFYATKNIANEPKLFKINKNMKVEKSWNIVAQNNQDIQILEVAADTKNDIYIRLSIDAYTPALLKLTENGDLLRSISIKSPEPKTFTMDMATSHEEEQLWLAGYHVSAPPSQKFSKHLLNFNNLSNLPEGWEVSEDIGINIQESTSLPVISVIDIQTETIDIKSSPGDAVLTPVE